MNREESLIQVLEKILGILILLKKNGLKHTKYAPLFPDGYYYCQLCDRKYFECNQLFGRKSKSKTQQDQNTLTAATHTAP